MRFLACLLLMLAPLAAAADRSNVLFIAIDDLNEATVEDISNDPALKPGDKVQSLEKLILRAERARTVYSQAYGMLIHVASTSRDRWHRKASEQAAKVMNTAGTTGLNLLWQIADTARPEVNGMPYDSSNKTIDYAKLVARSLNMEHLVL